VILADTSVWIDYLRGPSSAAGDEFDERLAAHDVLMCGPVAIELLTGVEASERLRLWEIFTAMQWADVDRADWFVAGDVRAELRSQGIQVSLPDVLIAAAALGRATLWTRDRHFQQIADVLEALDLRLIDS
jgi:predicted nucleic acid-binding protein